MIDEKKLIEELKEWADSVPPFESDIITDVIGFVEEQPKIGEWTPCSERLPEVLDGIEDEDCPEFNVMIKGASVPTTLTYSSDGSWFDDLGEVYEVIAWMPLPEPWKGKNDE